MYVIVWEFEARAGSEPEFERVYGPRGAWAEFFARGRGYAGTELLRDLESPGRYLTIDRWRSRGDFETFHDANRAEYAAIDRRCEGLTRREALLGRFELDAPAEDRLE
jgi:heme-degrading monooxygenase HmoA